MAPEALVDAGGPQRRHAPGRLALLQGWPGGKEAGECRFLRYLGAHCCPLFPCKPWSSTVGPIIKACPLAKKCKHLSLLPDPQSLNHGSFLLFISEHTEKPSTSAPQTPSFHFQVPATVTFAQLCANQAQSSQKLLFLFCLGPGLMLLLYFSLSLIFIWGKICFPDGSDSKKVYLQCRRPGSDPWGGKIP